MYVCVSSMCVLYTKKKYRETYHTRVRLDQHHTHTTV